MLCSLAFIEKSDYFLCLTETGEELPTILTGGTSLSYSSSYKIYTFHQSNLLLHRLSTEETSFGGFRSMLRLPVTAAAFTAAAAAAASSLMDRVVVRETMLVSL